MGIDLKIYPLEAANRIDLWAQEYEHLMFHRDSDIFSQIGGYELVKVAIEPTPIKYSCPDFLVKDAYGEPLTWILASEFSKIKLPHDISQKNKAIFEFLKTLPKQCMIILYWC